MLGYTGLPKGCDLCFTTEPNLPGNLLQIWYKSIVRAREQQVLRTLRVKQGSQAMEICRDGLSCRTLSPDSSRFLSLLSCLLLVLALLLCFLSSCYCRNHWSGSLWVSFPKESNWVREGLGFWFSKGELDVWPGFLWITLNGFLDNTYILSSLLALGYKGQKTQNWDRI